MAETIVLDSEALNALARPRERPSLNARARSIVTVAHETGGLVRVPAPVLAEVCRGARHDAAIKYPTAIIATGDPADIRRLASRERKVRILAL